MTTTSKFVDISFPLKLGVTSEGCLVHRTERGSNPTAVGYPKSDGDPDTLVTDPRMGIIKLSCMSARRRLTI